MIWAYKEVDPRGARMLPLNLATCTGAIDLCHAQWRYSVRQVATMAGSHYLHSTVRKDAHFFFMSLAPKAEDFFDVLKIPLVIRYRSTDKRLKWALLNEYCCFVKTTKYVVNYNRKLFSLLQMGVYKICQCLLRQVLELPYSFPAHPWKIYSSITATYKKIISVLQNQALLAAIPRNQCLLAKTFLLVPQPNLMNVSDAR